MPAESVGASEPAVAAPVATLLEVALADELLFAGVEAFMALAIVLTRESLATDCAHKRSLVCMRAEMRSQVVSTSKSLRTERALESCWVLLRPALSVLGSCCRLMVGVGKT